MHEHSNFIQVNSYPQVTGKITTTGGEQWVGIHTHSHNCNHNLIHCSVCGVVFCSNCGKEWKPQTEYQITYSPG